MSCNFIVEITYYIHLLYISDMKRELKFTNEHERDKVFDELIATKHGMVLLPDGKKAIRVDGLAEVYKP